MLTVTGAYDGHDFICGLLVWSGFGSAIKCSSCWLIEGTNSCLPVVFTVMSRDVNWKVQRGKKERGRMKKEKGEVVQ